MREDKQLQLRSEEVQEILSSVPHWMIRCGNVIILIIIFFILVISYFIKYPDIISTKITITTYTPPQKIITKTTGKIEAILIKDRAIVKKNTPLAIIENNANYGDMFLLKSIIDTINIEKSNFPFKLLQSAQLGDVESAYTVFQKEYTTNELSTKLQPYKIEAIAQVQEKIQLKERLDLLMSQKIITQSELELEKSDLDRYQTLFTKGIIASQELEKHKLTYLQAQKGNKNLLSSISSLKSSLNELNRNSKTTQINENKEYVNLERNLIQAFYGLKTALKNWELNYVLSSSIAGEVTFLQVWRENQFITNGDNVFSIIPSNQGAYIGKVKASASNSGKIKLGQDVNIKLASYPDQEFGMIRGVVKSISLTPDSKGDLLLDISLPDGLITSYKRKLSFQQEMFGNADIITEDLSLNERIFYQFKNIFRR